MAYGNTAVCDTYQVNGGDEAFLMNLNTPLEFGGIVYDGNIFVSPKGTVTFGQGDYTFWDFPQTPSISIGSFDYHAFEDGTSWGAQNGLYVKYGSTATSICVDWKIMLWGQSSGEPIYIRMIAEVNPENYTWTPTYQVSSNAPEGARYGLRYTQGGEVFPLTIQTIAAPPEPAPEVPPAPEPEPTPEPEPSYFLNAPTGLAVTPNIDGSVHLEWSAPEQSNTEVERYAVSWATGESGWGVSSLTTSITLSAEVFSSTGGAGVSYSFTVRADNDSLAVYSSTSEAIIATPLMPPPPGPTQEEVEEALAEAERLAAEQAALEAAEEAARLEAERIAAEQAVAEAAQIAAELAAAEEAARLEAERIAAEQAVAEAAQIAAELAAAEETARLEAERLELERLEAERVAALERAERERQEALAEAERLAAIEAARLEAERIAAQADEEARVEAVRLSAIAEEARIEAERLEAESKAKQAEELAAAQEAERLAAIEAAAPTPTPTPTPIPEPVPTPAPKIVTPDTPIAEVISLLKEIVPTDLTAAQAEVLVSIALQTLETATVGTEEYQQSLDLLLIAAQQDDIVLDEALAAIPLLGNVAGAAVEVFNALGNAGADMSPQVREQSEKVVIASVIVVNIAITATSAAASAAAAAARRP